MTNRNESGHVLLSSILLSMAAGGIVMVMSIVSMITHRSSQAELRTVQARYLAEGATEFAKQVIQDSIAKGNTPPPAGTATIDGIDVNYTITAVSPQSVTTDASGVQTNVQTYEIVAANSVAGARGRAGRTVNARWTPLFQYAVFFEQSLDILPGPDMELTGRIHTNGDLRLGCQGTLTLNTNSIRAVGGLRRWYKNLNIPTVGSARIRRWVANPFDPIEPEVYENVESFSQLSALSIPSTTGYDSLFPGYDGNSDGNFDVAVGDWLPFEAGVLERYRQPPSYGQNGNSLLLGAHGVTRAAPPPVESVAMYEMATGGDFEWSTATSEYVPSVPAGTGTDNRGYFHEQAGLRIVVAADGLSWTAFNGSGVDVKSQLTGAVTIDQTYDKRQGGFVPVARIDMISLNMSSAFPSNGLLYVSHYGMGQGANSRGVHLVGGADLKENLTVVTEGSAYIQGDYNTVTKNSAAILADAVNLLSNSWTNTTSKPTASDTTFNLAMIAGNSETTSTNYNGGLENFPRFHENWAGKKCTINGSMISAWDNQYATGLVSDAQYNAPIRVYGYDAMFNDVTKLPPFSPMIVNVQEVARW